jgi:hypothetical protein
MYDSDPDQITVDAAPSAAVASFGWPAVMPDDAEDDPEES